MDTMSIQIAIRNLIAHKFSSIIVGTIITFGTFLLVIGLALTDSVNQSMERTITSSLGGNLQVYSADAKDKLSLYGDGFMGTPDYGEMLSFGEVRSVIEALPEVKAMVPMGSSSVIVSNDGNELDACINELRDVVDQGKNELRQELITKVESILADRKSEIIRAKDVAEDVQRLDDMLDKIASVNADGFWNGLDSDPEATFYHLDTNIAPLGDEGKIGYFRNLGTDITRFSKHFSSFQITQGTLVPEGERGYLIAQRVYDQRVKNKVAKEFDRIKDQRDSFDKTIAEDANLESRAKRLPRQYRQITYELSTANSRLLNEKLATLLPEVEGNLDDRVKAFLTVDDTNFDARHKFFYDEIAPMIKLHWFNVGDTITLRAVTKSGYYKSINVKLWGIYNFKGLEKTDLAGAANLIDMISFRELYGLMSDEMKAELETIRQEIDTADVDRENAEAALFGESDSLEADIEDDTFDALDSNEGVEFSHSAIDTSFTDQDIDNGMAIHAAIILNEGADQLESQKAIEKTIADNKLGLQVAGWEEASGLIGQFIVVLRVVLYIAIFIIFLVALVIINNSMVMATLERVTEIGTMRAIGAQQNFIMKLFLLEIVILGIFSGLLGSGLGYLTIQWLGQVGIPAPSRQLIFLFSGPKLFPTIAVEHILTGLAVVLTMSLISTLYPARIATRIEPVTAMQTNE